MERNRPAGIYFLVPSPGQGESMSKLITAFAALSLSLSAFAAEKKVCCKPLSGTGVCCPDTCCKVADGCCKADCAKPCPATCTAKHG
jgi:hypothetical protein